MGNKANRRNLHHSNFWRNSKIDYFKFLLSKEVPWLKTGEVNYCRIYDTETYISKEGLARSSAKLIPENSVIVAMYGNTAGRVAINKIQICTNQACCNLVIDHDIADYQYVYYVLSNMYDKLVSLKNGAAQLNLNARALKAFEISFPDIETQKKIGQTLSAYDDLIENNQKQIKLLEEAAQRLYKEWFVDFRFPGYEDTKFIDGIPDGWRKQKISDFGEIKTGKTPSTTKESYYGGHIPFVKIPDMHNRIYPIVTETTLTSEGANTQKNQFIPKNSIMVSCIGTVGLVNISIELCQTNQQINSIMPNDEKDLYYIYSTMKRLKTLLEGVGSNGATMTNVNKTKFGNLEVLYPNYDLRDKYFNNCKMIFEKIFSLSVGIEKLTQARDRLLPKLMSGELGITQS